MTSKNTLVWGEAPAWLQEGRQWGYPDCCILFFNRVWAPLALATQGVEAKIMNDEPCSHDELALFHVYLEHRKHLDGTGYVPCPGCLARRFGGAEFLPSLLSENPCACDQDEDNEEIEALFREAGIEPVKPLEDA
jgi:hypothetical protein